MEQLKFENEMEYEEIVQENQRCSKFTDAEQQLLRNLVKKYKEIIICKKTGKVLPKTREAAWVRLAAEFNLNPEVKLRRTVSQLKNKWDYMKRVAKKRVSAFKKEGKKTGRGTPVPPLNDTTTFLKETVEESVKGLPSKFDCDGADVSLLNINESKDIIDIPAQDCESTNKVFLPYYSEDLENVKSDNISTGDILLTSETGEVTEKQETNNDYDKTPSFKRIQNKNRLLGKHINKSQNFINIATPQYTKSKFMELAEKEIDLLNEKLNCDEKKRELEIEILKMKSKNLRKENERILLECEVQREEIEIKKIIKQKLELEILILKKQNMNTSDI